MTNSIYKEAISITNKYVDKYTKELLERLEKEYGIKPNKDIDKY